MFVYYEEYKHLSDRCLFLEIFYFKFMLCFPLYTYSLCLFKQCKLSIFSNLYYIPT